MSEKVKVAYATGDGVGPEIMDATLTLFREAGVMNRVEFVCVPMGQSVIAAGEPLGITSESIRAAEKLGVLFKGPMATPKGGGHASLNVTLRKMWNTYANLRHFRSLPGVDTVYSRAGRKVDFYVVRENIEDTYGGIESRLTPDVTQCKRLITGPGSDEVHRFAFSTARQLGIRKVHCAHKANIMKITDGLFLERFYAVAKEYPDIEACDVIVDALCMKLVTHPEEFRMVVMPNLQGDIVSDLGAGLVGGLGFAPSANVGRYLSIFEAVHGTAPDIAGQGKANPTALILSGVMMLRHLGLHHQAALVENAVMAALEMGIHTVDFGHPNAPSLSTKAFVKAIIQRLGKKPHHSPALTVPEETAPTFRAPTPPVSHLLKHVSGKQKVAAVGCDLYVESGMEPEAFSQRMLSTCEGLPLKLVSICNRGTQVWPFCSAFTDCVDNYCVRFEAEDTGESEEVVQSGCLEVLQRVGLDFTVCSYDLLRTFDGKKGYSATQGGGLSSTSMPMPVLNS